MALTIDQELAEISDLTRDVQERYLKFKNEIVDIDRANVYTKDEVIAILEEMKQKMEELKRHYLYDEDTYWEGKQYCIEIVQKEINAMRES